MNPEQIIAEIKQNRIPDCSKEDLIASIKYILEPRTRIELKRELSRLHAIADIKDIYSPIWKRIADLQRKLNET